MSPTNCKNLLRTCSRSLFWRWWRGAAVFGGGLVLYRADGMLLCAIGVSRDKSGADHIIFWRARDRLSYAFIAGEPAGAGKDNVIYYPNGTGRRPARRARLLHSRSQRLGFGEHAQGRIVRIVGGRVIVVAQARITIEAQTLDDQIA